MDKVKPYLQFIIPMIILVFTIGILYGEVRMNTCFRQKYEEIPIQIALMQKDLSNLNNGIDILSESILSKDEMIKELIRRLEDIIIKNSCAENTKPMKRIEG